MFGIGRAGARAAAEVLMTRYWYIPPPQAPYSLVLSSSPYKQLIQQGYPVPL